MKLIIAIVNNEDSDVVAAALAKEKFKVTRLSTTGGFLTVGNTTFLIGTEKERVPLAKSVIQKYSLTRTHVYPAAAFYSGLAGGAASEQVTVGGATVMVLDMEEMEKY